MENFNIKEVLIYDKEKNQETFEDVIANLSKDYDGYVFYSLFKDPVGNSGSNPTWGDLYYKSDKNTRLHFITKGVLKSADYDEPNAQYAEKLWSLFGRKVLQNGTRIPKISMLKDPKSKETVVVSHIILDNNKEDMHDLRSIMFFKYSRQEMDKMKGISAFQDILEAIKGQVKDEDNYKLIEKQIVQALLMDSMTNNADRHLRNWALIRDKATNQYNLGLFDHSSSFLDMISERPLATGRGYWTSSYIKTDPEKKTYGLGESGDKIIKFLVEKYPEISQDFFDKYSKALPEFLEEISDAPKAEVNVGRIKSALTIKKRILEKLIDSKINGEGEYEYE